jgi:hypothetical protein
MKNKTIEKPKTDNKKPEPKKTDRKDPSGIIDILEEDIKGGLKDEKYADDRIILKLLKKGFESLSVEELAVTAISPTFEQNYSIRTGEEWSNKYKAKALERLNFAKFNIQWNTRENTKAPFALIFDLVEKGDTQRVTEYLRKHAQFQDELLHAVDSSKRSPLHIASKCGHVALVSILIQKGYSAHLRDKFLRTPLHIACQSSQARVAQTLLESGSDIYARDSIGRTSLHYASCGISLELVSLLLQNEPELVHCKDIYGRTSLHYAVWNPDPLEIGKKLLDSKAEVDALDEEGMTPLHFAADGGKGKIIPLLLKYGANPSLRDGRTQRTAYQLALTEHIREILIVYSSKGHLQSEEDKGVLSKGLEGEKVNVDLFKQEEKKERQQSKPRKEQKTKLMRIEEGEEKQYEDFMIKGHAERLVDLLKSIQDYGVKSLQHLNKPSLYSGSWMENIKNIENLNEYLNSLSSTEAVLRIYNILFPYHGPFPQGKGEESDMANFFNPELNLSLTNMNNTSTKNIRQQIQKDPVIQEELEHQNKMIEEQKNEIKTLQENLKELTTKFSQNDLSENIKTYFDKYQAENNELKENSSKLTENIKQLKQDIEKYRNTIDEGQKKENQNNSVIEDLTKEIKVLRTEIFKTSDTEKIITNSTRNNNSIKTRLEEKYEFTLNEEKSIYLFLKLIEENSAGLPQLLTNLDKDNDLHIFKNEMINLMEDLKLPLADRPVILKLAGYTDLKMKLPIKQIIDNIYKREEKKNKKLNEILFKLAYIMHNKWISAEQLYDFLKINENRTLTFTELNQAFASLEIVLPEIDQLYRYIANEYNLLKLDDFIEKLGIRKKVVDEIGNLDNKIKFANKVNERVDVSSNRDYFDIKKETLENFNPKLKEVNLEREKTTNISRMSSIKSNKTNPQEKKVVSQPKNVLLNKIINGELKIQVKSAMSLLIPKTLPKPYTYCLTLSLDGANDNKGYDSKEVLSDDNFVTFNWAARIPLIKKDFTEVGMFFKITLNVRGGNVPYVKLGECLIDWKDTLNPNNLDKFVIDNKFQINALNRKSVGDLIVQAKFIPIGYETSFYDKEGRLTKIPNTFKGYVKSDNNNIEPDDMSRGYISRQHSVISNKNNNDNNDDDEVLSNNNVEEEIVSNEEEMITRENQVIGVNRVSEEMPPDEITKLVNFEVY